MGRLFCLLLLVLIAPVAALAQEESRLAELLGADDAGFPRAIEPRSFAFPADHGPHPEYRNEWWYVTGNLRSDSGRRFGFELTIFRFALTPVLESSRSAWRTNQVYIAHLAVTNPRNGEFLVAERFARGALGLAGAQSEPFAVWIDDWRIASRGGGSAPDAWLLEAGDEGFGLSLELDASETPILNGDDGLSQKSDEPGNASYYYSITRLATEGEVRIGNDGFTVEGTSWLDREWSSSALADNQAGWDWFALQLDNDTELMFYNIRLTDGAQDRNSAGTYATVNGTAVKLERNDVELEVLDTWDSPEGGAYPSRWRLTVPDQDLELEIVPVMANQELFTTVRYWEGAVDVTGTARGKPIAGVGYVELTGYAESLADR